MQVRWDSDGDAIYISLAGARSVARTQEIDPGTLVDLDASNRLIGIEVINPARAWPLEQILDSYPIRDADALELQELFRDAVGSTYPFAAAAVA